MKKFGSRLGLGAAAFAVLITVLLSLGTGSLGWYALPCRQMAALQETYTFPSPDASRAERLADRLVMGEDERVFQPEQMDASTKRLYRQAVEGCKEQTRLRSPVPTFAGR